METNKATRDILNSLHGAVATQLKNNLDDPKILTAAIKFLKDNDITADLVQSEDVGSLHSTITEHLKMSKDGTQVKLSVNDMLEMAV